MFLPYRHLKYLNFVFQGSLSGLVKSDSVTPKFELMVGKLHDTKSSMV
jgi:hypothetical protein